MKRTCLPFLLVITLFLASCGGSASPSSTNSEGPASKMSGLERANHRANVNRELNAFLKEHGLNGHPSIAEANRNNYQAWKEYEKAYESHPELAGLFQEIQKLENAAYQAELKGDESAMSTAEQSIEETKKSLETKAETIPELAELKENASKMVRQINQIKADLASGVNEEGKELAEEYLKFNP